MQQMKKTFFRREALLLAAVLMLQACKPDTTPDAFTFASQSGVSADPAIESESVTISGINIPAQLSISGGEYSIDGREYRANPGVIKNDQKVRIRVRSSIESSGVVSATLTIGEVSGTFTVKTVNFTGRVEAEDASPVGGATTVAEVGTSNGKAVFVGSSGLGISIADSLEAKALILAYRTDTAGSLAVTVNGGDAGKFTLRPTAGVYATSSAVVSVTAGDVIAIVNPTTGGVTITYIHYVDFSDSPFKAVSSLGSATPLHSRC